MSARRWAWWRIVGSPSGRVTYRTRWRSWVGGAIVGAVAVLAVRRG